MKETTTDEFKMAMRAFDLFTLAERERALAEFARLRFPSLRDRFFEAVHVVIEQGLRERRVAQTPKEPQK